MKDGIGMFEVNLQVDENESEVIKATLPLSIYILNIKCSLYSPKNKVNEKQTLGDECVIKYCHNHKKGKIYTYVCDVLDVTHGIGIHSVIFKIYAMDRGGSRN
jgi:hypothetical protein